MNRPALARHGIINHMPSILEYLHRLDRFDRPERAQDHNQHRIGDALACTYPLTDHAEVLGMPRGAYCMFASCHGKTSTAAPALRSMHG
ncbi:MAG: hypothetical protein CV088_22155 [Nitrospira sp. LK70]|nr:hypothetical protein [Nitrospira sp. LK70]